MTKAPPGTVIWKYLNRAFLDVRVKIGLVRNKKSNASALCRLTKEAGHPSFYSPGGVPECNTKGRDNCPSTLVDEDVTVGGGPREVGGGEDNRRSVRQQSWQDYPHNPDL